MARALVNKKARFDYEILETLEAGIELRGYEVKAIREGKVSLVGSHVIIRNGEAWLLGADVAPYQPNNTPEGYDPKRTKKLLLKKEEISDLAVKTHKTGMTLVPVKIFNKNGKLKLEIALARHKKKHDKRETLKKKAAKREMRNA